MSNDIAAAQQLDNINIDQSVADELLANSLINEEEYEYIMQLLYPKLRWGYWTSKLMLAFGALLTLSGVIFFFAHNWDEMPKMAKFASIEIGIIACIFGVIVQPLSNLTSKILLLSASILIGVFLAVFGQIYQTGADTYQLFLVWSLLILFWTITSQFLAQWVLWLVITNIAILLWWFQSSDMFHRFELIIFTELGCMNMMLLATRECLALKDNYSWVKPYWGRIFLMLMTSVAMLIPMLVWVIKEGPDPLTLNISAITGFAWHVLAYYFYRYRFKDILSVIIIVLSFCSILVTFGIIRVIIDIFLPDHSMASMEKAALFSGFWILTICIFAVSHIRKIAASMQQKGENANE